MPCWPPSGSSWAPSTCSGPTSGCGRGPWSGRRTGAGRSLLAGLTLAGLAVAAALTAWNWGLERVAFEGAVSLDGITRYARAVLLASGALATLMIAQGDSREGEPDDSPPEVYTLLV